MSYSASYAIIQFSSVPERLEFVNIGVFLVVPEARFVGVRFARSVAKIEKIFGSVSKSYVSALKESFENRIKYEVTSGWDLNRLQSFIRSRSNDIRVSEMLPAFVDDPDEFLNDIFNSLVGEVERAKRLPKVATELGRKISQAGLSRFVEHPDPVELPEGLTISAPYAYQNGTYNLIDAIRLGSSQDNALKEAAKKALEAQLLYKHTEGTFSPKRLNVVADASGQSDNFRRYLKDMMAEHHAKLYDLSNVEILLDEIRQNSHTLTTNSAGH
ncbi:hypothetical protein FHT98_1807 [Bosea sp. AK1]|uniref:DUF3037 domain-containing protein n=1 Tax=Bosea sp. AK1 TaxID=2587160 RepID=UPI001150CB03|nr:DUF3037 domain-containing protein [Bosea sp. AK1]TQI74066.1 hypothetical protein FHT98_1807 [Bosea sp. AK1]